MAMIELRQLSKAYGAVTALSNLDLSVPEGCLYGLLGPNGAGKTTTLRILATLLAPDGGSVQVDGVDALKHPREVRRLLGYVAQEVAIDKILSGRELLQLQGDLYHLNRADRDHRIDDLIDRLAKSRRVRQSIIRHAFRYFMGRNEVLSDSQTLIDAEIAYANNGGSFKSVIISLLTSDSFIYRKET